MPTVYDKERTLEREISGKVEEALPGVEVLAVELSGPGRLTVYVDRATWLPKTITHRGVGGEEVIELDDYREALGFRFPHRFTRTTGGVTDVYEIRTVAAAGADLSLLAPLLTENYADFLKDVDSGVAK